MKNLINRNPVRILNFIILFIVFNHASYSQSPGWVWADGAGGNSTDRGQCVFTDPGSGDVVVAGFYESTGITFGSIALNNTLSNFTSDVFVARYNASGTVQWAHTYGSTGSERANGVTIDANGDVIITGHFDSPSLAFGSTTLTSSGGVNCFVVKLNSAGVVQWAKQSTGTESEYGTNIATDNAGNILVGGYFRSSTFTFGSMSASIIGPSSDDIFVAKFNPSGVCLWLNVAGGTKLDDLQGIAVDDNNNVIISGGFQSAALNAGTASLANFQVNTYDAFIIKYDGAGNLSWITGLGGFYSENAMNVTTDNSNNIFITGYFETMLLPVGSTTLNNTSPNGFLDIFTAKLNPSGSFQWAASCGGMYDDYGSGIDTDASGNVFVTGYFDSDTLLVGPNSFINNGSFDIMIAKYTNTGSLIWAKSVGGGGVDRSESISVTSTGEAYLTGYFNSNTINFGTTSLTNAVDSDVFLAKLDNTTGIAENIQPEWITIYSDFNSGQVHVQSQFPISHLVITNLAGQQMLRAAPMTNNFSARLNSSGFYVVEVMSEGVSVRKKVIVK